MSERHNRQRNVGSLIDAQGEGYAAFFHELHDDEFDEALTTLVDEATAIYETQFRYQQEDPQAERVLTQHFAPLAAETQAMFGVLARQLGQRDPSGQTRNQRRGPGGPRPILASLRCRSSRCSCTS